MKYFLLKTLFSNLNSSRFRIVYSFLFMFITPLVIGQNELLTCGFENINSHNVEDYIFSSSNGTRCSDECYNVCNYSTYYEVPVAFHSINNESQSSVYPDNDDVTAILSIANELLGELLGPSLSINLVRSEEYYPCIPSFNNPSGVATIINPGDPQNEQDVFQLSRYNPEKILNIYCVRHIEDVNSGTSGYVWSPQSSGWSWERDGIVLKKTDGGAMAETLVHEFGHYLSLIHVWGPKKFSDENCHDETENCTKGDLVPDTQPCRGPWPWAAGDNNCEVADHLWENIFEDQGGGPFCGPEMNHECANIMAYGFGRNDLTEGQRNRMVLGYNTYRTAMTPQYQQLIINNITTNQASVNWNVSYGSDGYTLRYKKTSENNWTTINLSEEETTSQILQNLESYTDYDVELILSCGTVYSDDFRTLCDISSPCKPCNEPVDVLINNSTTLQETEISGDIRVQSNSTLYINHDVLFSQQSRLIIQSGSKVIINNAKLGVCPTYDKWQGIKLAGVPPFSTAPPARVELINGASIENAVTGIDCRNSINITGTNYNISYGGGVVVMKSNSTIKNCDTGIDFAPYGWSVVNGWGTPETSKVLNSIIEQCKIGINFENNVGTKLENNLFQNNRDDIVSHHSTFEAINNNFNSDVNMYSDYPNFLGAKFLSNNFIEARLNVHSHGNAETFLINGNTFLDEGFFALGDLDFLAINNDFFDTDVAIASWYTAKDNFNLVANNAFYDNRYGNSVYYDNNIEYLTNCFSNTTEYDIEVNSQSSIHEVQGDPEELTSAGNCFDPYARIGTGTSSEHFDYWTKDGYKPSAKCKYPGSGNFTLQEAEQEISEEACGSGSGLIGTSLPSNYRNCECDSGDSDCKKTIKALEDEIVRLTNDRDVDPQVRQWLIAKYKRCIDRLKKTFARNLVEVGDREGAIEYLRSQTGFRYRIMAYAIMMNGLEYQRAYSYLTQLITSTQGEHDFVSGQLIYHRYLSDPGSFRLSSIERSTLENMGSRANPYSGYIRSLYHKFTGNDIDITFDHIHRNTAPRNTDEGRDGAIVFPNPIYSNEFTLEIKNYNRDAEIKAIINALDGRMIKQMDITDRNTTLSIEEKGVFFIQLINNGNISETMKIVNL